MNKFDTFTNFIAQKVMPLVYDESLSYYEILNKLITYTNQMVASVNEVIDAHNELASEYTVVLKQLSDLKNDIELMKKGFFIQDGTIELRKLSEDCLTQIQKYVVDTVHDIVKFVWFGLDDNGYFIVTIPDAWNEIFFSTDINGNLTLEY